MIFDASNPNFDNQADVSIPGIDRMMIIGDSESSFQFSSNISKFSKYNKIYHSTTIDKAVKLLKSIKVSIVIIDGDDEFDPVSCSRLISIQNSIARIILISKNLDHNTIVKMKNNGIIHGFISLPCETIMAHTIIIQEQAKYHINQTLKILLTDPPEGTPLYNRLNQSMLDDKISDPPELVAISIVFETLSKYNIMVDQQFEIDPVLFSSYFSAISIFSEKFISKTGSIESFEFNDQVVFVKTIDEVQYIFVFNDINATNRTETEGVINNIAQKLFLAYGDEFKSNAPISNDREVKQLIYDNLPEIQKEKILDIEQKAQIINIHEPSEILSEIYDETERAYEVHYVDTEEQLFDMINHAKFDIVIFNEFANDFEMNKYMLNIIKDESPFTQSIAIINGSDSNPISNILNVNDLDLLIDNSFTKEEYYRSFKKSIERSKSIQEGIVLNDLNRIYRLKNQPELMKAMLRLHKEDTKTSIKPYFYSLYILIGKKKYYSYFGKAEDNLLKENESLFFGFIDSLLTFTDELKNSPLMFSGIKYGKSNIIVKKVDKYYFIYFVGDLDSTNFDHVNNILGTVSHEIYEAIQYDLEKDKLSAGLDQVLDEICFTIEDYFKEITEFED